ncbi:hypothetical protein BTO30_07205 [Domibacillus antri]|uniref:Nuclease SbcCD subunit C n=1 Tax=Domibacillus antri TaxID=1714264 RepID=A0A1Q8Q6F4_9BACI|nr:SMC family ATPase [Domibacillus antri]OLN22923.1 hypothetical protein BTO30_07205 [Domibacillus antri]
MKPVKLTMTAFGPYAGRQVIDFSLLENRKMFVISGKTGSGKTTIFDAISFAIYGKPSGDNRSAGEMRSQFADPKLLTEVELLFELKGRQYVIRRTPLQEKKKARGNGTTTAPATAELHQLSDDGKRVLLSANVRDTDEKMTELIGLEANQFRQILMIPQGEFQKLLIASSQDKEKILQKLFQTVYYKQVEERLEVKADELKKEAGKTADQQVTLLKSLPAYSDQMTLLLKQNDIQKEAVLSQLEIDLSQMNEAHSVMKEAITSLGKKRDGLVAARERSIALNEQFDRLEKLLEAKKQLDDQLVNIQQIKVNMELAEKAEKLLPYEDVVHKAKKAAESVLERKQEAVNNEQMTRARFEQADKAFKREQNRRQEREEAERRYQQLEAMKDAVYIFSEAVQNERTNREKLEKTKVHGIKLQEALEVLEKELLRLETMLEPLQDAGERLIKADHLVEKMTQQLEQQNEWIRIEKHLKQLEEEEKKAAQACKEAEKQWSIALTKVHDIRQALHREQAALLASHLTKGEPCAVCGSIHHPNPAVYTEVHVNLDVLEQSEQRAASFEQKLRDAEYEKSSIQLKIQAAKTDIQKIKAGLPEDQTIFDLEEILEGAKKQRATAEEDQIKKQQWTDELQDKKMEKEKILKQIEQNRQAEANESGAHIEAKSILAQMEKTIPESMRDTAVFTKSFHEAKRQKEENERLFNETQSAFHESHAALQSAMVILKERDQAVMGSNETFNDAVSSFTQKLESFGFLNRDMFEEAKRFVQDLSQMKESAERYDEEQRTVQMRIDELQKVTEGLERVDITELDSRIQSLNEEIAEWTNKAGALAAQVKESIRLREAVDRLSEQMSLVEEEYRLAGHLYDIAHGKNDLKVTFERYVLASFLEDILAAANTRLANMTNGRFTLERQTARAKGNAQSGLELLAFDQYTGQSRHVKTLSGGESFKAALSLALGLAEVVQNYAGGVSLETMFVDEGFGTLDPESLDQAIETLMDIQSDGRLVGIISHVPELKERIDARLEVKQSDAGSRAAFVFSGDY